MSDIKLSQLPEVFSLGPTDIIPNVASGVTSKITAQNLADTLYALNSGSAFSKSWVQNQTQSLQPEDTIVISDNLVMKNSLLVLSASADYFSVGPLTFQRKASIYIGGHLLLVDTNVVNDGIISVAGGVILSGSSTITGTGIII